MIRPDRQSTPLTDGMLWPIHFEARSFPISRGRSACGPTRFGIANRLASRTHRELRNHDAAEREDYDEQFLAITTSDCHPASVYRTGGVRRPRRLHWRRDLAKRCRIGRLHTEQRNIEQSRNRVEASLRSARRSASLTSARRICHNGRERVTRRGNRRSFDGAGSADFDVGPIDVEEVLQTFPFHIDSHVLPAGYIQGRTFGDNRI